MPFAWTLLTLNCVGLQLDLGGLQILFVLWLKTIPWLPVARTRVLAGWRFPERSRVGVIIVFFRFRKFYSNFVFFFFNCCTLSRASEMLGLVPFL